MAVLAWLIGGVIGLYGLHRLAIWLEDRGYLYYRKKPSGGIANAFVAFHRVIEPTAAHVEQVHEHEERADSRGAAGRDDPALDDGNADRR